MKKLQLLPSVFQKVAIAILVLTVAGVYLDYTGTVLSYFKTKNHISERLTSFVLPKDYVQFTFYFNQAIPVLLIICVLLLILSRQKIEDEWIREKRLVSYKIAFFSVPVLTLLFLRFDSTVLIFSNLILTGLIQVVSFLFLVKIQPRFIRLLDEK